MGEVTQESPSKLSLFTSTFDLELKFLLRNGPWRNGPFRANHLSLRRNERIVISDKDSWFCPLLLIFWAKSAVPNSVECSTREWKRSDREKVHFSKRFSWGFLRLHTKSGRVAAKASSNCCGKRSLCWESLCDGAKTSEKREQDQPFILAWNTHPWCCVPRTKKQLQCVPTYQTVTLATHLSELLWSDCTAFHHLRTALEVSVVANTQPPFGGLAGGRACHVKCVVVVVDCNNACNVVVVAFGMFKVGSGKCHVFNSSGSSDRLNLFKSWKTGRKVLLGSQEMPFSFDLYLDAEKFAKGAKIVLPSRAIIKGRLFWVPFLSEVEKPFFTATQFTKWNLSLHLSSSSSGLRGSCLSWPGPGRGWAGVGVAD